mmetsp:Transcript_6582/g.14371  ORF Transcript_6582/g.14371 Transcript_6582/m.14371 type:complete len:231 (+) Transcript_6582:25-717(+)
MADRRAAPPIPMATACRLRRQLLLCLALPFASAVCPKNCTRGPCKPPQCSATCCRDLNRTMHLDGLCVRYRTTAMQLKRKEPKPPPGGPPLRFARRNELAIIAQRSGFQRGAELGVKIADFTVTNLKAWPAAKDYLLVDLWASQENYIDLNNKDAESQEKRYQTTLRRTNRFKDIVRVCRNYTNVCVQSEQDLYFDFIYIDARYSLAGVVLWESECTARVESLHRKMYQC